MKKSIRSLTYGAMIAALYVLLTFLSSLVGLDKGAIQFRLSELLCILPLFFSCAVPGLTIGCFLANLLCNAILLDVIFGTLATLLGAIGTRLLRKRRALALLVPVLSNALIVPFVLRYSYDLAESVWYFVLTIAISEAVMCFVLGGLLARTLERYLPKWIKNDQNIF